MDVLKVKKLPWFFLSLWGVFVLLLTLVQHWPAKWLIHSLSRHTGVAMHATGGDIWQGSLQFDNLDVPIQLAWSCRIRIFGVTCSLATDSGGQDGSAELDLHIHSWRIKHLKLVVPAVLLMQQVQGLQLANSVEVDSFSGTGDWQEPSRWSMQGVLHYAGGMTTVDLQGQHYSLQLPPVVLRPQHSSRGLEWNLTEVSGLLLGRIVLLPEHLLRIELAQRLLALSPLFQGRALTPDRIDVQVQNHW